MAIREVEARSILQKSSIPGTSYVINPYTGCVHGCVYCYARFMKRFAGHGEPWGTFLDAKANAPELLRQRLARRRTPLRETVLLSSVTDPYQPPESRCCLTRRVLQVLLEYQVPVSVLTKSDLVRRDIDLFRQFERCTVGLSLMTVDEELAGRFEPRAASPSRRLQALQDLRDNGIDTYAFFSPFLPYLSDIDALMEAVAGRAREVGVEALNPRGANWAGVERVLRQFYPDFLPGYRDTVLDEGYWDALEERTRALVERHGFDFMGFFRHGS
jgi:DNA repair photolyase